VTPVQREALLIELGEIQAHGVSGNGTAPVTIQIGFVSESNMVRGDGIVILEAPPAVLDAVIDWIRSARKADEPYMSASVYQRTGPHSSTSGVLIH
jgi:hypothetical protein